jgi:methionyl-tRNA formyltransferase
MKIVFFGTPAWAVPSLEALARSQHSIVLAVTQPPRRRGRGGGASSSPVGEAAARLGIPVAEPASIKSSSALADMAHLAADLFVVVAYGRLFPQALLDLPPRGCVNLHFSLLPRWRGAAPVQWAIAEGDTETGATTMRMALALDAGPVYLQERLEIAPGEHAPALGERLARAGARLLVATADGLEAGTLVAREQDDTAVTVARILTPEDGIIDWTSPAEAIVRRVRGFDPWPGQTTRSRKGRIRILEARAAGAWLSAAGETAGGRGTAPGAGAAPGAILGEARGALRIACGAGTVIEASIVQPEGRRAMSGSEAFRGRHLVADERLGEVDAAEG